MRQLRINTKVILRRCSSCRVVRTSNFFSKKRSGDIKKTCMLCALRNKLRFHARVCPCDRCELLRAYDFADSILDVPGGS